MHLHHNNEELQEQAFQQHLPRLFEEHVKQYCLEIVTNVLAQQVFSLMKIPV
jgi:hypothetical protein